MHFTVTDIISSLQETHHNAERDSSSTQPGGKHNTVKKTNTENRPQSAAD